MQINVVEKILEKREGIVAHLYIISLISINFCYQKYITNVYL